MTVIERERVVTVTETERRALILEAAALEIEVRGWARATSCDRDGRVCAGGGLLFALGQPPQHTWFEDGDMAAMAAVWGWTGPSGIRLAPFNDTPGRTADEVTFLLRWRACEIRDGR